MPQIAPAMLPDAKIVAAVEMGCGNGMQPRAVAPVAMHGRPAHRLSGCERLLRNRNMFILRQSSGVTVASPTLRDAKRMRALSPPGKKIVAAGRKHRCCWMQKPLLPDAKWLPPDAKRLLPDAKNVAAGCKKMLLLDAKQTLRRNGTDVPVCLTCGMLVAIRGPGLPPM